MEVLNIIRRFCFFCLFLSPSFPPSLLAQPGFCPGDPRHCHWQHPHPCPGGAKTGVFPAELVRLWREQGSRWPRRNCVISELLSQCEKKKKKKAIFILFKSRILSREVHASHPRKGTEISHLSTNVGQRKKKFLRTQSQGAFLGSKTLQVYTRDATPRCFLESDAYVMCVAF